MSRNDEIEDLGFQDIFLALEVTYGIKFIQHQNRRHQCHHQARRSLLQWAACLLLTLRVSRAGSKIASFRSLGPARPSSPWFQFPITVKDKKEVKLFAVIVVCCCCCCCPLLLSVVCQVVCLDSSQFLGQFRFGWAWRQFQWDGCSSSFSHLSQKQPHALSLQLWRLSLPT